MKVKTKVKTKAKTRAKNAVTALLVLLCVMPTACGAGVQDADVLLESWRDAELGDASRHAVWEVTWREGPVQEPLVVEVWAEGHGWQRERIEVLQAPYASLSGLTYVRDGENAALYGPLTGWTEGSADDLSPGIARDALGAVDAAARDDCGCAVARYEGRSYPEAGAAYRLRLSCEGGGSMRVWVDEETRLASRLELRSERCGYLSLRAISIEAGVQLNPALFDTSGY